MLQNLRESAGGELPTIVNMGSMRQYTTTLSAYFARARHAAGIERFADEQLRKKSRGGDVPFVKREWQLKSQDLVASVTDDETSSSNEGALRTGFGRALDSRRHLL